MTDSRYQKIDLLNCLDQKLDKLKTNRLSLFFPSDGIFKRSLYPKHISFFEAGTKYRERAMIAANRVGKTVAAGVEMSYHLTGLYPRWWKGRKFDKPVDCWAAGQTNQTTRDIIQLLLLGKRGEEGTGLIPADKLERFVSKQGVSDAVETIYVKHVTGMTSVIGLKSYDQGPESFMGTAKDVIWLDEEPSSAVYAECLTRTMTVDGMVMCTFTPLNGLSSVVLSFMPNGKIPEEQEGSKFIIQITWNDVPHLSEESKNQLWANLPPHERDARSQGIPTLGSGAVYPIVEEDILVHPFDIPGYWPRFFGMDVGWNKTACAWFALDKNSDVLYLYNEYYRGKAEAAVHADAIMARGEWIKGVIDPASRGRSQHDGTALIQEYRNKGMDIDIADNSVEAGIFKVFDRMCSGRLKVFTTCMAWRNEFRVYRRDQEGKIVKENDHLMDATRYGIMSGISRATREPLGVEEEYYSTQSSNKNPVTGY
jgi:phage terminase large subunit-like protein